MSAYSVYTITCADNQRDILLALLADAGMDSFEETDHGLLAYARSDGGVDWATVLNELRETVAFTYEVSALADKNWNAEWESQFQPIQIGQRLLIRASFHPTQPGIERELVIDPKMAFGTGHHATTYMMCERILDYFADGKQGGASVLDYGSGTGVLAILAKQVGAGRVDAVDIERPAYESTLENAERNGVTLGHVVHGQLDDVPVGKPYDLVVANINRNVLLATGGALYERLRAGGTAYLSGILDQDAELLTERMQLLGFRHVQTYARDAWRCFAFERD
ncbi:Release factor glutamine methyltransferase [Neolewinella maritima]|uniref:Ribosomal protein L11 methyltransferase n=1 Tax=Neolewinella maritima TaxID=1383882 RepID=A0ABM9B088_9BACT|nr:50S ribosomal protein L11 methyltransferase [Neolewinella maritima]CAH1000321.1 Release factor glutamine methyltransferase [Neolewinella maritima]